jgi:ABC-type transport system substrate-binding protein
VLISHADAAADIKAIDAGKADYIAEPGPSLTDETLAASYGASAHERHRYYRSPLLAVDELVFNTTRGPLASARLRRAVNDALDRPALAAALGDRVSDRYLPTGIPGYQPRHYYPLAGPDLKTARALAADTRRRVTLAVCSQPSCVEVGRVVAADLARIGLRVLVRQYSGDLSPTTERAGADVVLARIYPPYPDPVAALRPTLGRRFASRLDRIARLSRPGRLTAAGRLESELLQRNPPAAAFGTPTIPELFSARIGCKTFQPLYFGVDLGGLCLAGS